MYPSSRTADSETWSFVLCSTFLLRGISLRQQKTRFLCFNKEHCIVANSQQEPGLPVTRWLSEHNRIWYSLWYIFLCTLYTEESKNTQLFFTYYLPDYSLWQTQMKGWTLSWDLLLVTLRKWAGPLSLLCAPRGLHHGQLLFGCKKHRRAQIHLWSLSPKKKWTLTFFTEKKCTWEINLWVEPNPRKGKRRIIRSFMQHRAPQRMEVRWRVEVSQMFDNIRMRIFKNWLHLHPGCQGR